VLLVVQLAADSYFLFSIFYYRVCSIGVIIRSCQTVFLGKFSEPVMKRDSCYEQEELSPNVNKVTHTPVLPVFEVTRRLSSARRTPSKRCANDRHFILRFFV
jgi:hypothetical protein